MAFSERDNHIPRILLEESFEDETHLVMLMLRLPGVLSLKENYGKPSTYGLQMEEMQIRPRTESSS